MQLGAQRLEVLVGVLRPPLSNLDGSSYDVLSFRVITTSYNKWNDVAKYSPRDDYPMIYVNRFGSNSKFRSLKINLLHIQLYKRR